MGCVCETLVTRTNKKQQMKTEVSLHHPLCNFIIVLRSIFVDCTRMLLMLQVLMYLQYGF
jgi:hypothetical protein